MGVSPACISAVKAASGDQLTDAEARALIERMEARKLAIEAEGKLDDINAKMMELARADAEADKIAAALARKHAALSAMRYNERIGHIDTLLRDGVPYQKAILAVLEGTTRNVARGRESVGRAKLAYEARWLGGMMGRLQREVPAFDGLMRDKQFLGDVVREMHQINRDGGRPGVTGNEDAKKAAAILADTAERTRRDLNRQGAAIGKLDGWAGPQRHSQPKAMKAGQDAWVAETADLLDLERTFPDLTRAEAHDVLGQIWENIVAGRVPDEIGAAKGRKVPANVAKALGKSRVLHFKDPDAWLAYNARYGEGHVVDGIVTYLRRAAMTAAQMKVLGPNPEATMDRLLRHYERQARRDTKLTQKQRAAAGDALANGRDPTSNGAIVSAMAEASGMTLVPNHVTAARYMSGFRAVQSMAKLGGAVISSVSDLVSRANAMKYQGKSLTRSYAGQFRELINGRGNAEQKELAYMLGEGFDGPLDMMVGPYWSEDAPMGRMHKLQSWFFRLSGLTWWTDSMRASQARMLSNWMARNSDKSFADLPSGYRAVMMQQGMTPAEWDAVRATKFALGDGREYITPDRVASIPDAVMAKLARQKFESLRAADESKLNAIQSAPETAGRKKAQPVIKGAITKANNALAALDAVAGGSTERPDNVQRLLDEARFDLEMKLRGFISDEVGFGVIEPDAASRRFLLRGTRPGTVAGEALRFLAQFKGFPVAFAQRVGGRAVMGAVGETALERNLHRVAHIGTLQAGMFVAGYMAMTVKDFLRGFGPRDPEKKETVIAAMLQGGGLGIYGDFLFGQTSRFGSGVLETVAGPGIGAAADAITLAMKLRDGDAKAGETLNFALQNTPFINLFYARPALDFLILNELRDALSPGFLARQAANRRRDYGQVRWADPIGADLF